MRLLLIASLTACGIAVALFIRPSHRPLQNAEKPVAAEDRTRTARAGSDRSASLTVGDAEPEPAKAKSALPESGLMKAMPAPTPEQMQRAHDLLSVATRDGYEAAVAWVRRRFSPDEQDAALAFLLGEAGRTDLKTIRALYPHFQSARERQVGLGLASLSWVTREPELFLRFIDEETSGQMQTELLEQATSAARNRGLWDLGITFASRLPTGARTAAFIDLGTSRSAVSPQGAFEWAANIQDPEQRSAIQRGLAMGIQFSKDASVLATALPHLPPEAKGTAQEVLGSLAASQGMSPAEVLKVYGGNPNVMSGAIKGGTKEQITELLPHVRSVPESMDRRRIYGSIASRLFSLDRQAAVDMAWTLQGSDRDAVLKAVVTRWYLADQTELTQWMNALSDSRDQDVVREEFTFRLRGQDPNGARRVAEGIKDKARREKLLRTFPER